MGLRFPHLVEFDPEGMALKFGLNLKELPKTDGEFRCREELIVERLSGALPKFFIDGEEFLFDHSAMTLRPGEKRDQPHREINLNKLPRHGDKFYCYYNIENKKVQHIPDTIGEMPKNVVLLFIPGPIHLDPIAEARSRGLDELAFVNRYPIQQLKAQTYPLNVTPIAKLVERNQKRFKQQIKQVRKKRGKRL